MAWRKAWTAAALGTAFTVTSPAASAFFPPVPAPGEIITVVPPVVPPPAIVPPIPPVPPVCRPPHKPVDKPGCGCDGPESPQTVPEPATLVASVAGLAALAGWRRIRKVD